MLGLFKQMLGSANERALKKLGPEVKRVNSLEAQIKNLSDEQLKAKTANSERNSIMVLRSQTFSTKRSLSAEKPRGAYLSVTV